MHIIVVNAGSSSVKFTCFGPTAGSIMATGTVERIGRNGTLLHFKAAGREFIEKQVNIENTAEAVAILSRHLVDPQTGCLNSLEEVHAVGHRVVHGGEKLNQPMVVDAAVKEIIREYFDLAPLHNPPNLEGIEAAEAAFPKAIQVGIFDTAFHNTIPAHAFMYALPLNLYREDKIRRYGFHGISHQNVSRAASEFLGHAPEELNLITCHLGNGCSITAVRGGRSLDTSMGFTPLEGLVMGTRCGDLDPAIALYLMEHKGLTLSQVGDLLNKKSGLLGLSGGKLSDLRDIVDAMEQGDDRARNALDVFCYRIKKYIGAYMAAMGGVDAIVFTAGIGENSPLIREKALSGLRRLGITVDHDRNQARSSKPREISAPDSPVKVLVVPTREEREIAGQVMAVLEAGSSKMRKSLTNAPFIL
ncbi:MAG: acetate kinase [Deltaproteobacteria bacterium]|nr:acetate kinase [Deltaproteobacteria bacterium]